MDSLRPLSSPSVQPLAKLGPVQEKKSQPENPRDQVAVGVGLVPPEPAVLPGGEAVPDFKAYLARVQGRIKKEAIPPEKVPVRLFGEDLALAAPRPLRDGEIRHEMAHLMEDMQVARRGMFGGGVDMAVAVMLAGLLVEKVPEADKHLASWRDAPERNTTKLDFHWGKVDQATFRSKAAELEAKLADPEATEVARYRLGGGINGTYIVVLSNGAVGVWKPVERESQKKLRSQLEEDHQGRREVGAYVVDKAMGHMARVPPAVFRKLGEQEGALLAFVPGAQTAILSPSSAQVLGDPSQPAYRKLAVFDHTIGNVDRHQKNWLVVSEGEGVSPSEAEASPVPIDHGLCFPLANTDQGDHNFNFSKQVQVGEEERQGLESLMAARSGVESELQALDIKPEAVSAMFERAQTMLEGGQTTNAWRGLGDGPEAELEELMKELNKMMGMDPRMGFGMMNPMMPPLGMAGLALGAAANQVFHKKMAIFDRPAGDRDALAQAAKALDGLNSQDRRKAKLQIVLDDQAPARARDRARHDEILRRYLRDEPEPPKNAGG